jgi:hypothetical protein
VKLHHTFKCPLEGFPVQMTVDLGMTQAQYAERLQADEYALLLDIPDWDTSWGDKPVFPLTGKTIEQLPFVLIRYVCTRLLNDALDSYMEVAHPLSKTS